MPDVEYYRGKQPDAAVVQLAELDGTETAWLWPERLPVGHLTVVAGEAASGKSLLAAEIAARVSRGDEWCDAPASGRAGSVVIAQAKAQLNGVLTRRLLAAGADPREVLVVNRQRDASAEATPGETLFAALIAALGQAGNCSLVVVDDLLGWLDQPPARPEELAGLFRRLSELAARRHLALLVVWRLEKKRRGGPARTLEILLDAADVVWLVANDPCRSGNRLLVCAQNQLGRPAGNLAFSIEKERLMWREADARATADEVVASFSRTADRPERRQAAAWLSEMLAQGPIEATRLFEECHACRLSERTVRRAAADLGLHPIKVGQSGPWLWGFDTGTVLPAIDVPAVQNIATSEPLGKRPNSAVLEVELRCDAAPTVAAVESVDNLADSAGAEPDAPEAAAAPTVAAFEPVGSLPNSAETGPDRPDDAPAPTVAAFEPVGSLPNSAETELKLSATDDAESDGRGKLQVNFVRVFDEA